MDARNADWAAEAGSIDWKNVRNKPTGSTTVDISQLTASSYSRNQIPQWTGSRFVGVNASSLIDTSGFFSLSNKPYSVYQFPWDIGNLTPFRREKKIITLTGVAKGAPVIVVVPLSLDGVLVSADVIDDALEIVAFNSTPYDVDLSSEVFQIYIFK